MPFNVLHHHAEHEHLAATVSHHEDEHSCELDNHFCQPNINQPCEHQSHIATPVGKCFSCEFHFIKHFENSDISFNTMTVAIGKTIAKPVQTRLLSALLEISNKGPPRV